jgi:hypothetical protein
MAWEGYVGSFYSKIMYIFDIAENTNYLKSPTSDIRASSKEGTRRKSITRLEV